MNIINPLYIMNAIAKLIGVLFFGLILITLVLLTSCGPKPQYQTALGKKKMKYYNSIQYGKVKPKNLKSLKRSPKN